MVATSAFVRPRLAPHLPPPRAARGPLIWMRRSLFSGPIHTLFTLLSLVLIVLVLVPAVRFLLIDAVWQGDSREACVTATGACWPFVKAKFGQFIYGFYPAAERWRPNLVFALGAMLLTPLLVPSVPHKGLNAFLFFALYPVVAFVLLLGGVFDLEYVETRRWGGLLVTLVVAFTGIVASLPLGILLALGRRSELPVVRALSITFIEFWRGVPLITVLFFATYMLPLFLPQGVSFDALLRVLVGVALFSAAYMAEVVRGGLQAIPRAQYEGSYALGLRYWQVMGFIVMPQALTRVIPGIVNNFIGLFKDTTLVLIVAIFDLLGQLRASFSDPAWATPTTLYTGFAFAGMIYFVFCFAMSRYSLFVERRIGVTAERF